MDGHVPNHAASLRYRAASLGLLGRLAEGRQAVQRLVELVPDFTIARARRHIESDMNNIFRTPGVAELALRGASGARAFLNERAVTFFFRRR